MAQTHRPHPHGPNGNGNGNGAAAAAAAAARMKILRIGVILGDKIVEERLIRERGTVTIGQSARNTFAVPAPELPKSWPLFQLAGDKYVLNVADSMDGRLSDGGQVMTMAQLKSSGKAVRQAGQWALPLSDNARGKIVIGDMTLLFQFVLAPPLQPRPQLPHSIRGSVVDELDPRLAVIVSVSLVAHFAFWLFFRYFYEEPQRQQPDQIPAQFARLFMEKPKAPKVSNEGVGAQVAEDTAGQEAEDKGGGEDKGPKDKGEPKGAPDSAAVAQKVQNTAVLKVLGARSKGGSGSFIDVTGGRDAGGDLDKGLSRVGASGGQVAAVGTGGLGGGIAGNTSGTVGEGNQTGVTGPTGPADTGGQKVEKDIKVEGDLGRGEGDSSGGLDPEKFTSTVKKLYYPRVLQCYKDVAKQNPNAKGKVDLSLTINSMGRVKSVNADGFDAALDACIERSAKGWNFPKPAEDVTFDIYFILRPAG